ncbi:hypothetical protein JB92DRAFT_1838076 [Gautieria morchelliformis]|nr:hypothetical protein JB92DRAFT_1838076 [Gautieria morchelliformis]
MKAGTGHIPCVTDNRWSHWTSHPPPFLYLSPKGPTNLIFLNLCFTWIFSSITFSIGLYRLGPASIGFPLPFIHSDQECLTQAALVSGAQVMTDTAMCALIVQSCHPWASHSWTNSMDESYASVSALLVSLGVLVVGSRYSSWEPAGAVEFEFLLFFYIWMSFFFTGNSRCKTSLIILKVCIIRILYRHWRFFRRTEGNGLQVSLSVVFRVIIFCVYRVVVAVAYVATVLNALGIRVLSDPNSYFTPVWVDMLQAGTPLVAFLIFGTSKEFLDALMFLEKVQPHSRY